MFEKLSIISFVVILVGIMLHFVVKPPRGYGRGLLALVALKLRTFRLLLPRRGMTCIGVLKRLALAVGMVCFAVLLITGFVPLWLGSSLHAYLLMLHVSCAPVFIVCVVFLGLTWARKHSFTGGRDDLRGIDRACFWCLLVLSLPLTMSILLGMVALFGTDGQIALFNVHRYTALAFSLLTFIYAYGLMRYIAQRSGG